MKVVPISEDESGTAAEETRPTSRPVDVPRLPQTDTHRYTSLMVTHKCCVRHTDHEVALCVPRLLLTAAN